MILTFTRLISHVMKKKLTSAVVFACAFAILAEALAQAQQTEEEFQKLMPVTGTVETFFDDFKLDHSFPLRNSLQRPIQIPNHQQG
jgi:hypothetical protein